MTKREELLALRSKIALLAATKTLRDQNHDQLITLRDQEIQLHLAAVNEASEQKRPSRTRGVHYHERPQDAKIRD